MKGLSLGLGLSKRGGGVAATPPVGGVTDAFLVHGFTVAQTPNSTLVNWGNEQDIGGNFNPTTGTYTVPSDGYYYFNHFSSTGSYNTAGKYSARVVRKNGVNDTVVSYGNNTNRSYLHSNSLGTIIDCQASDLITIFADNRDRGCDSGSFTGFRIPSGVSTLFKGYKNAASGAAGDVVGGYTEEIDLGNDFNPTTGVFTVPEDGLYFIRMQGNIGSNIAAVKMTVLINGSPLANDDLTHSFSNLFEVTNGQGYLLSLTTGDTVSLEQTSGQAARVLLAGFRVNFLENSQEFSAYGGTIAGPSVNWTENFDPSGNFNATTGIYTVPEDGVYLFGSYAQGSASGGTEIQPMIVVNNAGAASARNNSTGAHTGSPYTERLQTLSAGDEVRTILFGANNNSRFFGFRIG